MLGSSVPRGQDTRSPSGDQHPDSDGAAAARRTGLQETTWGAETLAEGEPLRNGHARPVWTEASMAPAAQAAAPLPALEKAESTPGTTSPARHPAPGGVPDALMGVRVCSRGRRS